MTNLHWDAAEPQQKTSSMRGAGQHHADGCGRRVARWAGVWMRRFLMPRWRTIRHWAPEYWSTPPNELCLPLTGDTLRVVNRSIPGKMVPAFHAPPNTGQSSRFLLYWQGNARRCKEWWRINAFDVRVWPTPCRWLWTQGREMGWKNMWMRRLLMSR